MSKMASRCSSADGQDILPGLPNEVALLILVRLPRALLAPLRYVSRSWRHALHPSSVNSLRDSLHISELWIVFHLSNNTLAVYDPLLRRLSSPLPYPIAPCNPPQDVDKRHIYVMGAIDNLIIFRETYSFERHSLDVASMQIYSSEAVKELHCYICATFGDFLYMAKLSEHFKLERLNVKTKLQETLPELHVQRENPACVVLNGQIHVISNNSGTEFSGETWDPSSEGHWTLVPELWPHAIFSFCDLTAPLVAVLEDTLYALSVFFIERKVELMCYDTSTKRWDSVGYLPVLRWYCKSCCSREECYELLGVGNELWVVVSGVCNGSDRCKKGRAKLLSCVPTRCKPLSWKTSFIYFPKKVLPLSYFTVKV